MFALSLFTFLRRMAESTLFLIHSSFLHKSLHSGKRQLPLSLLDSKGTSDLCGEEVFHWVISSDLLSLNDHGIPTLLHRSYPDISYASFSLTLSCSWKLLQELGSDSLQINSSICSSLSSLSPQIASIFLQFLEGSLG